MPRNTLKSFPTGMLRRGLAHFHPGSSTVVQPPIDSPPEPPGTQHVTTTVEPPHASGPAPVAPVVAEVPDVPEAVTLLPVA